MQDRVSTQHAGQGQHTACRTGSAHSMQGRVSTRHAGQGQHTACRAGSAHGMQGRVSTQHAGQGQHTACRAGSAYSMQDRVSLHDRDTQNIVHLQAERLQSTLRPRTAKKGGGHAHFPGQAQHTVHSLKL
jgi:hypothetical protein